MKDRLAVTLEWLWVLCSVAVLGTTLCFFDGSENSDAVFLLAYGMLVLSVPIGYPFVLIMGNLVQPTSGYLHLGTIWLWCFVAGYYQWFKLVPWIVRRLPSRRRTLVLRVTWMFCSIVILAVTVLVAGVLFDFRRSLRK